MQFGAWRFRVIWCLLFLSKGGLSLAERTATLYMVAKFCLNCYKSNQIKECFTFIGSSNILLFTAFRLPCLHCLFLPNSKLIGVTEEHVLANAFHSCVIKQPSMNNRWHLSFFSQHQLYQWDHYDRGWELTGRATFSTYSYLETDFFVFQLIPLHQTQLSK